MIGRMTPGGAVSYFHAGAKVSPYSLAAGPDDAIWFHAGGYITRMTRDGNISERLACFGSVDVMTAGPDSNMWFSAGYGVGRVNLHKEAKPLSGMVTFTASTLSSEVHYELPYVKVTIDRLDGGFTVSTRADKDGRFDFGGVKLPVGLYTLSVELAARPPWTIGANDLFTVMHNGSTVIVRLWDAFTVDASGPSISLDMHLTDSDSMTANIPTGWIDDVSMIYYNAAVFWDFVHDTLQFVPTLDLPLEYRAFYPGVRARYGYGTKEIDIGPSYSVLGRRDQPMNLEWHESAHYLQDCTVGSDAGGWHTGDENHGGYANHCTGDSWWEGWANFWPMALNYVAGEPDYYNYAQFGSLDVNHKAWEHEAFAIAGLFLDLIDPVGEEGWDNIQITVKQLWDIISARGHEGSL